MRRFLPTRSLIRFALDSALEGDGFEPSVPRQVFLAAPSIPAQFTFRNINRLASDRDRWFESISLQQPVSLTGEFRGSRRNGPKAPPVIRICIAFLADFDNFV
jgi:hypothetical protein